MSRKLAYLTVICLLIPMLFRATSYAATSPTDISAPTATSLNVELVGTWPVADVEICLFTETRLTSLTI